MDRESYVKTFLTEHDITYLHPFPPGKNKKNCKTARINHINVNPYLKEPNLVNCTVIATKAFLDFMDKDEDSTIYLDISFCGQRFRTNTARAEIDPGISGSYFFKTMESPIKLINYGKGTIIAVTETGGKHKIYGHALFEWRLALSGYLRIQVELLNNEKVECGMVDIKIEFTTKLASRKQILQQISNEFEPESIICKLTSRLIPTPYHAMRFCHLLFKKNKNSMDLCDKAMSIHQILSCSINKHNVALLLTSFLQGFGLNAYVSGDLVFTMGSQNIEWDFITGRRRILEIPPIDPIEGFMVFYNPKLGKSFDFEDPENWTKKSLPPPHPAPALIQNNIVNDSEREEKIRKNVGKFLGTNFDPKIEAALRPLAFQLEDEKLGMETAGGSVEEVHSRVLSLLSSDESLKAATLCARTSDEDEICRMAEAKAKAFKNAKRIALVSHTTQYAEGIEVTWIVIGAVVPQ